MTRRSPTPKTKDEWKQYAPLKTFAEERLIAAALEEAAIFNVTCLPDLRTAARAVVRERAKGKKS